MPAATPFGVKMLTRLREGNTGNPQLGRIFVMEERTTGLPVIHVADLQQLEGGVSVAKDRSAKYEAHEAALVCFCEGPAAIAIRLGRAIQGE